MATKADSAKTMAMERKAGTRTRRDGNAEHDDWQRRYHLLLDNAPLGILISDEEGRILEVNESLLQILGSPSAEATRAINLMTFPPLVAAGVVEDVRQCLRTGLPIVAEHPYLSKWGKRTHLRYHIRPLTDAAGAVVGIQAMVEDFTAHQEAEESLRQALADLSRKAAQLQEANAELAQYASAVSHDIKAPLRTIHRYADFLREDLGKSLEGEQQSYLGGLARAVRQAEMLVDDLLELAKIGQRDAAWVATELASFVRKILEQLQLPANVEITWSGTWVRVTTDPILLRQIFQNLILNATKFNRSNPIRIELSCQELSGGLVELGVKDNGIGIEPRFHERIFGVFERLHSSDEYEGTGIGLALVRKAVSKLQGSVRVISALAAGSTFVVTLPAFPKEHQGSSMRM